MILINRFLGFKRQDPGQARFDRLANRLESPIEQRFWAHAYGPLSALGQFSPQVEAQGYRLDFAFTMPSVPLLKMAIELDGYDYHSTQEQRNYDTTRDRVLLKAGWQVVRFTGSQINRDVEGCVRETVALAKEWARWLRI